MMRLHVRPEVRANFGAKMAVRFVLGAAATVIPLLFFPVLWPEFIVFAGISGGLITATHRSTQNRWVPSLALVLAFFIAVVFATTYRWAPLIAYACNTAADMIAKRFLPYDDER